MPMRRISTGLTRVGFDQDPSPLTEGMLHAASTLGELWPRLKQIEMEKKQHQDSVDERKQRYEQESQDRAAAIAERKQERADALENQKTNHADYLKTAGDTANRNAEENQFKHNVELAKMGVVGDEGQLWQNAAAFANKKLAREETQANHAVYTFFTDKDGNTYRRNTHTGEVDHIDPNDKRASATPQAAPVDPQQGIDNAAVADERTGLRGFGNLWGALGPSRQEITDRASHNVDVINRTNMRKGPPQATGTIKADSPSQLWAPSPAVPQASDPKAMDDNSLHDYLIQNEPGYAEAAKDPRFNRAKALQFARSGGK